MDGCHEQRLQRPDELKLQPGSHQRHPPRPDDAISNTLNHYPAVTVSPTATPRDFFVGNAQVTPGAAGRVDQSAGTVSTGGGNWAFVGTRGGTGTYNLAETTTTGGTYTGFG